jgi:hypothetical protein
MAGSALTLPALPVTPKSDAECWEFSPTLQNSMSDICHRNSQKWQISAVWYDLARCLQIPWHRGNDRGKL